MGTIVKDGDGNVVETIGAIEAITTNKAAPTAGDASEDAATGPTSEVNTRFVGFQTPGSHSRETTIPLSMTVSGQRFLEPPEHPVSMYKTYQLSAYWEALVEALVTNVYKAPYVLRSTIPFDRPEEAKRIVKEALIWDASKGDFNAQVEVSDKDVEKVLKDLETRAIIEKHAIDKFFREAVPDMSYRQLWDYTGQDEEVTGDAYWEIIRDTEAAIARMQWVPSISVRGTPQESALVGSEKLVRHSVLKWTREPQIRRYRRWAQIQGQDVVTWFKEYGDPRVMSRKTGDYYSDEIARNDAGEEVVVRSGIARMQIEEGPEALPATELLHWRIPFGGSSLYGKPRTSGVWPGLVGSRDLDEENARLVADEAVPSLMLLISGGVVGTKAYNRLKQKIEERKKGRKGILMVEAVAGTQVGMAHPQQQPKIDVVRLKSEQNTDALFQEYDKRNEVKAAGAYRMPRSALGKDIGQNRATVAAMQRYTEDQVYGPKRADRDEVINDVLFADLDILMWKYVTQSQQTNDPQTIAEVLRVLVESGVITPNEAREHAGQPIFNKRLEDLKGLWTEFPPRVLTVLLQTKNQQLATALLGEDKDALDKLSASIRANLGLGEGGTTTDDAVVPVKAGDGTGGQPQRKPEATGGPGPSPDTERSSSPASDA